MSNDDQRLAPLRAEIDSIDQELLELLSKRARAAQAVGHIKNELLAPIFRPEPGDPESFTEEFWPVIARWPCFDLARNHVGLPRA
jgi:hypothetical protein